MVLGICLFQLLCGDLPEDQSDVKIKTQMRSGRWEEISDNAKDLVEKLIQIEILLTILRKYLLTYLLYSKYLLSEIVCD